MLQGARTCVRNIQMYSSIQLHQSERVEIVGERTFACVEIRTMIGLMAHTALSPLLTLAILASAAAQTAPNAAEEYHRLAELRAARTAQFDGDDRTGDVEQYFLTGMRTARADEWLAAMRPLGAELARTRSMAYTRTLDRSQGFDLLLPHLGEMRTTARTMAFLLQDAAERGDNATARDLLRAQLALADHAGEDGLIISSLVSVACTQLNLRMTERLMSSGAIDADTAKTLIADRETIAGNRNADFGAAMTGESSALNIELAKLRTLPTDERSDRLGTLLGPQAEDLSDASIDAALAGSKNYYIEASAAMTNPDRAAGREQLAALHARLDGGEFGELTKSLAPALTHAFDRFTMLESELALQNADLRALANATKQPADFMNGARLYLKAAAAAQTLDAEAQRSIDGARLAPDEMPESARVEARRAIDGLRATVIETLLAATNCGRCEFPDELLNSPTLLPIGVPGVNGAARLLIADGAATFNDARDSAPHSARHSVRHSVRNDTLNAAIALLRMSRHYANSSALGRSIVAQESARDAIAALHALELAHALDASAHELIAREVVKFKSDDPFGYRSALKAECARLAQQGQQIEDGITSRRINFYDPKKLAALSPNAIAFLVALSTPAHEAASKIDCNCAFDGPMLSLRRWFDLDALADARAQLPLLAQRARKVADDSAAPQASDAPMRGTFAAGSALAGLRISTPINIEQRMSESTIDLERLQLLSK